VGAYLIFFSVKTSADSPITPILEIIKEMLFGIGINNSRLVQFLIDINFRVKTRRMTNAYCGEPFSISLTSFKKPLINLELINS